MSIGVDLSERTLVSGFSESSLGFSSWIRLHVVGLPLAASAGQRVCSAARGFRSLIAHTPSHLSLIAKQNVHAMKCIDLQYTIDEF